MGRVLPPRSGLLLCGLCALGLAAAAVAWGGTGGQLKAEPPAHPIRVADHAAADRHPSPPSRPAGPRGTVTLAFAGDVHFQLHLAALLEHPRDALGPITRTLKAADLTMVNLESSITGRGTPDAKEREVASQRYYYRTSPAALDFLAASGVDVVTMANNHGADYGPIGLKDTLAAIRTSPIPVIGIGRDSQAAFAPYRVSVRGTRFAFLAADASRREGSSNVWAAAPTSPGIAAARDARQGELIAAVRAASLQDDVVVVYLHWGTEEQSCPDSKQQLTAQALAEAGADVIVGSHAHVLLGSGWLGGSYVDYGLGNFVWYHNHQSKTGVLRLAVRDGHVVGDSWTPARIQTYGRPVPLRGADRADAIAEWQQLRRCTGLAANRDGAPLPPYSWSVRRIDPPLKDRMRYSYRAGCPVPLSDLRYLQITYVGFDGYAHTGEMVVHGDYAVQVATVFEQLYDARWPIRRMRLVDDYGGSDNESMAANNTSGFNCRRVAGSRSWSAHAYGAAIDINPVQNPDLIGGSVAPRAGRRFAAIDRSTDALTSPGVISINGPVVHAFSRIGWEWGGNWSSRKDFQHFAALRGAD